MSSFYQSLSAKKSSGVIPVIPDIKLISPKEGDLLQGRSPVAAAQLFEQLGAPAISVVTEPHDFGGSLELLSSITAAVSIPVLRKDFITCEDDLRQTCAHGAARDPADLLLSGAGTATGSLSCCSAFRLGTTGGDPYRSRTALRPLVSSPSWSVSITVISLLWKKMTAPSLLLPVWRPWRAANALLISESGIATPEQARTAVALRR